MAPPMSTPRATQEEVEREAALLRTQLSDARQTLDEALLEANRADTLQAEVDALKKKLQEEKKRHFTSLTTLMAKKSNAKNNTARIIPHVDQETRDDARSEIGEDEERPNPLEPFWKATISRLGLSEHKHPVIKRSRPPPGDLDVDEKQAAHQLLTSVSYPHSQYTPSLTNQIPVLCTPLRVVPT